MKGAAVPRELMQEFLQICRTFSTSWLLHFTWTGVATVTTFLIKTFSKVSFQGGHAHEYDFSLSKKATFFSQSWWFSFCEEPAFIWWMSTFFLKQEKTLKLFYGPNTYGLTSFPPQSPQKGKVQLNNIFQNHPFPKLQLIVNILFYFQLPMSLENDKTFSYPTRLK